MKKKIKILTIVGTRPNFIKIAPLIREMKKYRQIEPILVHTGQHYNYEMSQLFFQELKIPKPDYNLGVGSGSHARQTAKIMERLEPVILKEKPDLVLVVGDVNSTLAGALAASKLHILLVHVEAGLRSFDKNMPEEINRKLTDHLSDLLFSTEPQAIKNLINEGISRKKIFYVGNVMIDSLTKLKTKSQKSKVFKTLGLKKRNYIVLTLHRPETVDNKEVFEEVLGALREIPKKIKIIWPIHPRAKKRLRKFNLLSRTQKMGNLVLIKPLGYIEMLSLNSQAKLVLTDSGGVQEETTVLNVPCLTLRKNTERPITVQKGTNVVVGTDKNKIIKESLKILRGKYKKRKALKFWDGKTSQRIIKILLEKQNKL